VATNNKAAPTNGINDPVLAEAACLFALGERHSHPLVPSTGNRTGGSVSTEGIRVQTFYWPKQTYVSVFGQQSMRHAGRKA
jgi:hypothetical protein